MTPPRTCPAADLLVERLRQHGVEAVFGYPGGQLTPVYDALYRTPGIRHILARHEQAAAFMADGYARASGRPGVCLAVCGPGVYNAATPLAAAHTDSVPVLLISGQVPSSAQGLRSGYYHENEQLAACGYFTKARVRVTDAAKLVEGVDLAWRQLLHGRPGPVLLEVPVDVLRQEGTWGMSPLATPPAPPAPSPSDVEALAAMIRGSARPVILAGGGVVSSGAESALARVASRLGAPVFHTANGKCALPGSHPLAAGMPWDRATSDLTGMADFFSPLWKESDALVAIGCRFSQLATGSWTIPFPEARAHIDIDPEEIGRHYKVNVGIAADARLTLEALLTALPAPDRAPWATIPARGEPLTLPGLDACSALRRALPPDTIVSADVTRLAYILMAKYPLESPRSFLHPAGAVAMGYGLPAALGAKAAFPERPVLAVAGDGGFQMSAMELATAVQENLPVVVLLVNDSCLTLIKSTQERRYERRFIGVDLHNPDFGVFARSFGVGYWRAGDERQLEEMLAEAFTSGRPALVEVRPGDAG
jgi:thiamine pyrophosphate-dependent acetolactate synthase large subunit-like protein